MLLLAGAPRSFAQYHYPAPGARSAAMGGSFIGLTDFWSAVGNIAGTALHQTHIGVGISHLQPQNLDYSTQDVALAIPLKQGCIVTNVAIYGNKDYRESNIEAGYAIRISPCLSVGVAGNLLSSHVSDSYYPSISPTLTASAGVVYCPSDQFQIGAHVFNPLFAKLDTENDSRAPVVMTLGAAYRLAEPLLATVEIEKNIYLRHTVRLGVEYTYRKLLAARVGFGSFPSSWSFGLGYLGSCYDIDIAAQLHPFLGLVPQISSSYRF